MPRCMQNTADPYQLLAGSQQTNQTILHHAQHNKPNQCISQFTYIYIQFQSIYSLHFWSATHKSIPPKSKETDKKTQLIIALERNSIHT